MGLKIICVNYAHKRGGIFYMSEKLLDLSSRAATLDHLAGIFFFLWILCIVLFFITVATISNAIHSYNDSSSQKYFTLIESGDYKFKMYQYSYWHSKHTVILIDESLTGFDIDSLKIAYDEKQSFHIQEDVILVQGQ